MAETFQGKPCKRGHSGIRYVVGRESVECCRNRRREKYASDPEQRAKQLARAARPEVRAKQRERNATPEAKAKQRAYRAAPEARVKQRERQSVARQTPATRARSLYHHAARRAKQKGEPFLLTHARVLAALLKGTCERTGAKFALSAAGDRNAHRFAPSLDKIDRKKPYSDSNVQVVIFAYNMGKGEMSDEEYLAVCTLVAMTCKMTT